MMQQTLLPLLLLWLPFMLHFIIPRKVTAFRWWITFAVNYFIFFLAQLFSTSGQIFVLVLIALFVTCLKGYKYSKLELTYIPVCYIFIMLLSSVSVVTMEHIFNITTKSTEKTYESYIGYWYITMTVLVVLTTFLLRTLLPYTKQLLNSPYKKITLTLGGSNVILCIAAFLISKWAARINHFPDEVEITNLIIFCTYTFLLCFITVIVLKFFRDKEKMDRERQQYENLKEYSAQIETMYTNLRAFKHDYINILTSMSEYINEQDYKGLERYFKEHILPTREKLERDNYRLNQLKHIKDLALKGLISTKLIYAHEIGIDVYIDILDDMEHISMREIDLSRIMGIFLDNAIEAALETEKKEIKFCMIKEEKHIAIILMNTFVNHNLPISQLEKNGFSTKGENRGLGLATVKEILSSYHNIYKTTQIQGEYFCQKLEIENA